MKLANLMQWTKSKIAGLTGGDVPVTTSTSFDDLIGGRTEVPALDLFENNSEFRLVLDVAGATPRNTHLTWNEVDTLAVQVRRAAPAPGTPWVSEYDESNWYREISLSQEVDGAKASATVRDGVVTVRLAKRNTRSSKLIPVLAG